MITITIPGNPIPLQRHRHNGKISYNPQKKLQEQIYWTARAQMPPTTLNTPQPPYDTPLEVTMTFHMPIPPSYSRKKRELLPNTPHHHKPDLSNLVKFYEDALEGCCWTNDSIISTLTTTKLYSELPRTVITIRQVDNDKN